jgi:hypothetical protein
MFAFGKLFSEIIEYLSSQKKITDLLSRRRLREYQVWASDDIRAAV